MPDCWRLLQVLSFEQASGFRPLGRLSWMASNKRFRRNTPGQPLSSPRARAASQGAWSPSCAKRVVDYIRRGHLDGTLSF